jgi:hypothetical protein
MDSASEEDRSTRFAKTRIISQEISIGEPKQNYRRIIANYRKLSPFVKSRPWRQGTTNDRLLPCDKNCQLRLRSGQIRSQKPGIEMSPQNATTVVFRRLSHIIIGLALRNNNEIEQRSSLRAENNQKKQ